MKPERLEQIRKRWENARNGYDAANNQTYAEHVGELLKHIDELTSIKLHQAETKPPAYVEKGKE